MFKIGEFSRLVRVSPRMLRHYEKCGLFLPAEIDRLTGYRQYSAGQIPLLGSITALRDMGFSIDEIGETLPYLDDHAYMDRVLRTKTAEVKSTIKAEQEKLALLTNMSSRVREERNIMMYEVELKTLPAVKVLTLRDTIPAYRDEGMLWERLGKYMGEQQIACIDSGYSTFYDEEYKESNPDIEIAIPVESLGTDDGEFKYQEYAEIPLAATLRFSGPFDGGYDAATEKLAYWMEENDYGFAGLLRGHTLVPPNGDNSPEEWLVELQAPVQKREG